MKKYLFLIFVPLLIISCSKNTDKDYFDQGNNLLKEKEITEAVKSFEQLLSEYPKSELAPKALLQLASVYQNKMDSTINPRDSFDRAQKYFKQVYDKYPSSPDAPRSLFLSGFILANDLRNYDEATRIYKLFLEKYPSDPLATSAQEELNNMGLTPEEILKRNEVAKK